MHVLSFPSFDAVDQRAFQLSDTPQLAAWSFIGRDTLPVKHSAIGLERERLPSQEEMKGNQHTVPLP